MSEEILKKLLYKVDKMECNLASASSLNGGFDKLLVEIEHIKETQNEVLQGMRGIKKSIYEPDSGLFSRVKQLEVESDRRMEFVNEAKPFILQVLYHTPPNGDKREGMYFDYNSPYLLFI